MLWKIVELLDTAKFKDISKIMNLLKIFQKKNVKETKIMKHKPKPNSVMNLNDSSQTTKFETKNVIKFEKK